MKKSFADILSGMEDSLQAKMAAKLPHWAEAGCGFPGALALEQCSSEAAALYKAGLVSGTLCDLTGGMGVDCWAFSRVCSKVFYNERNPGLAACAERNFGLLGISNVECACRETVPGCEIPECDWIYLDPARRSEAGRKVFLLKDCSPDVTALMPYLWKAAPRILLKLSPMADITMLAARLGKELAEVHVVALKGEVKELLCVLRKDFAGEYTVTAVELEGGGAPLVFRPSEEAAAPLLIAPAPVPGDRLFEPSAALLKAGAFKLVGLPKLAPSTHIYIGESPLPGRNFLVLEVLPMGKETFRTLRGRYPRAEVSARNIPMTSEGLRARLGVSGGSDIHIFGVGTASGRLILVTRRIPCTNS